MDRQSEPRARNVAVIIAHGVGEADPGYAAATLSRTLEKCSDFRPDEEHKVRYLPDPQAPADQPDRTFPVFVSSGEIAGGPRITFAELYWADLSRIAPSRMAAVLGFFRIIFESHHFVDGMLHRRQSRGSRILRHLLLAASWLLRGPIIGLVATLTGMLWVTLYVPPGALEFAPEPVLFGGISALLFLLSAAVFIMIIRRRDTTWYDPVVWTMVASASVTAFFAFVHFLEIPLFGRCPQWPGRMPDCRQNYMDYVYTALTYLWQSWGIIILLAFVVAICVAVYWRAKDRDGAPPVLTALGVVLLQFVLWTALVGTAAMPMIYRVEEVKALYALQLDAREQKVRPLPSEIAKDNSAQKLFRVVPWNPRQSEWTDRLAFGYGFNGVMIAVVLLICVVTHLRRSRIAKRSLKDPSIGPERMPRMVVGRAILIVLMFVTFWQAVFLATQVRPETAISAFGALVPALDDAIADGSVLWTRWVMGVGWVSTLALPVLASLRIGNFVHIARDLIDHQYSHKRASMLTQMRRSRDPELWPRRARIQARLEALLTEMLRGRKYDHFIFAVHSQGSVITYDFLRDAGSAIGQLGTFKPDIVTFGSPLAHIYQYYFAEYRELEKDIMSLQSGIGRWINVYRIDDYIGTDIDRADRTFIDNKQIGRGGHVDYWREERLAQIVCELATRPASADGAPAELPSTA